MDQEYYFKEGCYIQEWHNSEQDDSMSIAKVRVLAKSVTKLHSLAETTERYVILAGQAKVTVGNQSWTVGIGDVIIIEPAQAQKIDNLTNEELHFLAICTPRFKLENYLQLED